MNTTTKKERDALTMRAMQLIAMDETLKVINSADVISQLVREKNISRNRAIHYTARAARILRGTFVRGRTQK